MDSLHFYILSFMPIRLAQARLIPQYSRDNRPDHMTGIRTPLGATGYVPDGRRRPFHQGKDAETPTESKGNLTCAGSYPKAPTCVNRIGMLSFYRADLHTDESFTLNVKI